MAEKKPLLRFRRAETGDAQAAVNFYYDLIDAFADIPVHPVWTKGVHPSEAFIREAVRQGELLFALLQNRIVGAVVMNHRCEAEYAGASWGIPAEAEDVSILHIFAIAAGCQGQGFARALLREALRQAAAQGQKAVRLDVMESNFPAQRLYVSEGFQCRGTLRLFYESTGWTDFRLYERIL